MTTRSLALLLAMCLLDGSRMLAADEVAKGPQRLAVQSSLERAATWLVQQQDQRGAFASADRGLPAVPLTSLALWALATSESAESHAACEAAVAFLLDYQQADGGIYQAGQGLCYSTAAVARQGLGRWLGRQPASCELTASVARLDEYLEEFRVVETLEDRTGVPLLSSSARIEDVRRLQQRASGDLAAAVDFLSRTAAQPVPASRQNPRSQVGYGELLSALHRPPDRNDPAVLHTYRAIQERYTLTSNPDLIGRRPGLPNSTGGLYYYYLTVARTLGSFGEAQFQTADEVTHDWVAELSSTLLAAQRTDGAWVNGNERWWEGEPVLVTSYAMLSLEVCRDLMQPELP